MNPPVAILLLAAGAARRMRGADKLVEPVGGVPLLRRQALAALATRLPVTVTLPVGAPARVQALDGLAVAHCIVEDAGDGMGTSLRTGIAALPAGTPAAIVMLADMPEITTDDLMKLATAFAAAPEHPHRLCAPDGRAGHPVILPARLFAKLAELTGDTGARVVLKGEEIGLVAAPDDRALIDLDTPEDWAAWHARTGL